MISLLHFHVHATVTSHNKEVYHSPSQQELQCDEVYQNTIIVVEKFLASRPQITE